MTKKRVATRAFVKRIGRKRNDVKNDKMVNLHSGNKEVTIRYS